jgi:hypothetical protein
MNQITNIQKVKHQNVKDAPKASNMKMPIFSCSCGSKILIVPDLSAMNKAVKNHIRQHKLRGQPLSEETLTQEILSVLSKTELLQNN